MRVKLKVYLKEKYMGKGAFLRDRVVPLEVYILYKGAVLQVFVFPQANLLCLPHPSNLPQDA